MRFELSSPTSCSNSKRRRLADSSSDSMESSSDDPAAAAAKTRLAAICEELGREIRVFMTSTSSSTLERVTYEEPDDFYEFTVEDYLRTLSTKKEDKFLKTRKIREAEEAARRSRITKAIVRVRFPDNYTLEVKFHPSETFQSLIDLLKKVIARPDLPFYLFTTPPRIPIKDMSRDFYSAGFIPGAIVYFSYDLPEGHDYADAKSGPYIREEIQSLNGIDTNSEKSEPSETTTAETSLAGPLGSSLSVQEKPAEKKSAKPKWFKR